LPLPPITYSPEVLTLLIGSSIPSQCDFTFSKRVTILPNPLLEGVSPPLPCSRQESQISSGVSTSSPQRTSREDRFHASPSKVRIFRPETRASLSPGFRDCFSSRPLRPTRVSHRDETPKVSPPVCIAFIMCDEHDVYASSLIQQGSVAVRFCLTFIPSHLDGSSFLLRFPPPFR